jgi:hypothetical protein
LPACRAETVGELEFAAVLSTLALHRRGDLVAADADAVGFQRPIILLHRAEDDDLGSAFRPDLSPETNATRR